MKENVCISINFQWSLFLGVEYIINEVDSTKFLGIDLDNKLNRKKHIAYVSGKVTRGIVLMIKARKHLNCFDYIVLFFYIPLLIVLYSYLGCYIYN